jgi:hypothetical protein
LVIEELAFIFLSAHVYPAQAVLVANAMEHVGLRVKRERISAVMFSPGNS